MVEILYLGLARFSFIRKSLVVLEQGEHHSQVFRVIYQERVINKYILKKTKTNLSK